MAAQTIHQARLASVSPSIEKNRVSQTDTLITNMESTLDSIRYQVGGEPWPHAPLVGNSCLRFIQDVTHECKNARARYDDGMVDGLVGDVSREFQTAGYSAEDLAIQRRAQHLVPGKPVPLTERGMTTEPVFADQADLSVQCQADDIADEWQSLPGVAFHVGTLSQGPALGPSTPWLGTTRGKYNCEAKYCRRTARAIHRRISRRKAILSAKRRFACE